nr:mitochondrial import inner membrane translocase subunit Tim21 [Leptinotarsa decemlineata]
MFPLNLVHPILRKYQITKFTPIIYKHVVKRHKTTKKNELTTSSTTEVDTNVKPLGEKVKETTKTVSYLGVILLGVGVTGSLFYAIFSELFSSNSPNNIYSKAVKKCISDHRIEDKLGYPITAYGEETRRGRRQHVSHLIYAGRDGRKHMRMKFHLKGSFHTGTVHLDMVENDAGNYEYRYLFVEVDDMLRNTIMVEDNRKNDHTATSLALEDYKY